MSELTAGLTGEKSVVVCDANTAAAVGSGCLPVFSTPAMLALMELTAAQSVAPYLPCGSSTVGTHMDIEHLSATPVGLTVRCTTTLTAVDGRKLTFSCEAADDAGPIGRGTQERFIVDSERFMAKADKKRG